MSHDNGGVPGMIGRDPAMLEVYRQTRLAARGDLPVLIVGETGTGKELVAKALHELSAASGGPFIDINCAALPESLAEAELFGSERGAFTGATKPVPGFLELADGGTLFLDEACSLAPSVQAKLLRAIELQEFWRVGGRERRHSHFRVVTAVGKPMDVLVASGACRADFGHRVSAFTITIPPLRARQRDIRELAAHFLAAKQNGHPPKRLTPDAIAFLARHAWPGNVRELKAVMERLHLTVEDATIGAHALMNLLPVRGGARAHDAGDLFRALADSGWNTRKAARALGVSRATLYRRIKEHGLAMPERPAEPVS
jgi:transcriptional regulator with PAS, ATPase and Fis domain